MKFYLCSLFFIFSVFTIKAQTYKTYLDASGNSVDKSNAQSYITYHQQADSSWLMKQYDMRDTIMSSGTFKDRNLQIPNGKFFYFYKSGSIKGIKIYNQRREDTLNHIKTSGQFKDGVKTGVWLEYFDNGQIQFSNHFENGKKNGISENYNYSTNTVYIRTNYVNDVEQGECDMLNTRGDIIQKDIYKDGQLTESHQLKVYYTQPKPPKQFYAFVNEGLKKITGLHDKGKIDVVFIVNTDGRLTKPEIFLAEKNSKEFNEQLIALLLASPNWQPATKGKPAVMVEDAGFVTIDNDKATITEIPDNIRSRFYDLTH
jgi:antitoxin component YwqK of YwqJK toxin-antitoxin module